MRKLILTIFCSFFLTGCFGDWIEFSCLFVEDEGHCYQAAAVQESDPQACEKVTSDFTDSNPPRDKCLLMIAENTGDPTVCDDIKGGPASYTREDCVANTIARNGPEYCAEAADETACRTAYAINGQGCGYGYTYNQAAVQCVSEAEVSEEDQTEESSATLTLSNAEKADITSIRDAAAGKYMDLLQQDFENEIDPSRKAGLEAYISFLGQAGETMEEAQANWDSLQELKRVFLDTYDESMAIEHMSVEEHLDPGLYDQVKERIFGSETLTGIDKENADAENALAIYEVMLNQQSENDFLKQGKAERLKNTIVDKFKNDVTESVTSTATELAEGIAGTAFGAVTQVGDALEAFKSEAKKQTFIGLTRAYNRRRAALEASNPSLTPAEAHRQAVAQVQDDPYQDLKGLSPIRFENLLDNDCSSYNGELCIHPDVWWTALDKTYRYNNK